MAEPIKKNNEVHVDGENAWSPSMLLATLGNNMVTASPSAMLSYMMKGKKLGMEMRGEENG